jgi:MSHA pilin protein MshC
MNPFMKRSLFGNGFTLIELIAIILLIGIMAVFAMPRFFDRNIFDIRASGDQAQSLVRYAQKLAIAQHRNIFVVMNSGIALCYDAACGTRVLVADKPATAVLPSNVSAIITPPGIAAFYFDALGRPFNASSSANLPRTTITLAGGGSSHQILIEPETGYVH